MAVKNTACVKAHWNICHPKRPMVTFFHEFLSVCTSKITTTTTTKKEAAKAAVVSSPSLSWCGKIKSCFFSRCRTWKNRNGHDQRRMFSSSWLYSNEFDILKSIEYMPHSKDFSYIWVYLCDCRRGFFIEFFSLSGHNARVAGDDNGLESIACHPIFFYSHFQRFYSAWASWMTHRRE